MAPSPSDPSRCPHGPVLVLGGRRYTAATVREVLGRFVSEARQARIAAVVARRTYTVVPVLERLSDPGNLHAVLRSAEGLGYGAAHLVAPEGDAAPLAELYAAGEEAGEDAMTRRAGSRAAQGAHKWLDLAAWPSPDAFADAAHARGYAVAATHLAADAVPIAEWDFTRPTALVLGNERDGISGALLARADANVLLPLDGFMQSYNVSVAAALALYHARADRLARQGFHGDLNEAEQAALTAQWYVRSVPAAAEILAREASPDG